jgi:WD40 repeat protein
VNVGAVTSLALSHDHTWIASGHASGHVRVFDLNKPGVPARTVPPTSPAAVRDGRREGHFPGTTITSIGFVAGRHTAIVTADENGLVFYHSLGKVLFVDATDVIRILGKYPDDGPPEATPRSGIGSGSTPFHRRRERKANVILAMAPLPLGTCPHRTDGYNLIAMVTPVKLVIVGLKPKPMTWYRRLRRDNEDKGPRDRWKGTLAWFPSVEDPSSIPENPPSKNRSKLGPEGTMPILVFSWGKLFHLIRVSEKKVIQSVKNAKTGKISEVEIGAIVIEEVSTWTADGVVLAVRWLSANVSSLLHLFLGTLGTIDDGLAANSRPHTGFSPSS